jgi:hypothetical protein
VLDRASTFAQPEIVNLLKTRFVPVAINQAHQRRQQDTEGEFYRKLVLQRSGIQPNSENVKQLINQTTQGFYIATADGELLLYNNNRDPEKVLRLMKEKLKELESRPPTKAVAIASDRIDTRWTVSPPDGGLVISVHAKVLGGYKETDNQWQKIFQTALSRDNLWVSAAEHQAIAKGVLPASLLERIARFHLVDNTRGEPPMWEPNEIQKLDVSLQDGKVTGRALLQTMPGNRGYDVQLKGDVEVKEGKVVRFDVVALGDFWGEGPFTKNAPEGKFPLGISFTLADGTDIADGIPPQGSRGWLQGYLQP